MRERRSLTIEDVFEKEKYIQIVLLLSFAEMLEKKVKFLHLRYKLCVHHGIKANNSLIECKKFFSYPNDFKKEFSEPIKKIEDSEKSHKGNSCSKFAGVLKKSFLEELSGEWFYAPEEEKFSSFQGLCNALKRLKKLEIIDTAKDQRGYDYYIFTIQGNIYLGQYNIHRYIDSYLDYLPFSNIKEKNSYIDDVFQKINQSMIEAQKGPIKIDFLTCSVFEEK